MSAPRHPAAIDVNGIDYLRDAKGGLVPISAVKAVDLLMDELARDMIADAHALSKMISDFRERSFQRFRDFQDLVAQEYGAKIGGKKGNGQLLTFDGCGRVQVAVQDLIEFGPEIQAAKILVDECVIEWTVGSKAEIQALVSHAFEVDKKGQINRSRLVMLQRLEITDPRWLSAMEAVRDSTRVVGSKEYIRFHERMKPEEKFQAITIDLASA